MARSNENITISTQVKLGVEVGVELGNMLSQTSLAGTSQTHVYQMELEDIIKLRAQIKG